MSCLISGELAKRHFCDEADLVGFGVGFDQPPVLTPGRSEYCILLRTGTLAHADRRHKDRGARLGLPPRHRRLLHPRDRRPDRRCPHRSPRSPASTTPFPADRFQPQRLPLGTDKGIGFTARTFRRHAVGASVSYRRGGHRHSESKAFSHSIFLRGRTATEVAQLRGPAQSK